MAIIRGLGLFCHILLGFRAIILHFLWFRAIMLHTFGFRAIILSGFR